MRIYLVHVNGTERSSADSEAPPKKKLNPADAKLNGDMIGTGAGLLSSPRALAYDPGLHLFQED